MKTTISPYSELISNDLSVLEKLFGKCSGRGRVGESEDIDWQVEEEKGQWWTSLSIIRKGMSLVIEYVRCYYAESMNDKDIEKLKMTDLPVKWQNKFNKFLKAHTVSKTIIFAQKAKL